MVISCGPVFGWHGKRVEDRHCIQDAEGGGRPITRYGRGLSTYVYVHGFGRKVSKEGYKCRLIADVQTHIDEQVWESTIHFVT